MQPIDMRMDDVELFGAPRDRFQQKRAGQIRVGAGTAEAKRAGPHRMKLCARGRVAAREQRHPVAELDQLVDQPGAADRAGLGKSRPERFWS